ncbi:MAG: DUF86 domain-containing protein [Thermoplasmatota archaeon]
MVEAAHNIRRVARGRASLDDVVKQAAVIRWFEVMGEAAAQVSDEGKTDEPAVPWRELRNLRNVLIHDYMEIDLDRVWDAVGRTRRLLPRLEAMLKA